MAPLKVGIIGAGIGGLAAAIGLRRAGHEVEIFERSEFSSEVGAAIGITPNGSWVLDHWNIEPQNNGAVPAEGARVVNGQTLEKIFETDFDHARYGQQFWLFHRVDLHRKLRETAVDENGERGCAAKVRLGCKIKDMDSDHATLTLEDGTIVQKDMIIIADGVRSQFIHKITDLQATLYGNGMSTFRALVPFSEINKFPDIREFFKTPPSDFWAAVNLHPEYRKRTTMATYPCRNGEILNVALLHATRSDQREEDDWHSDATIQAVLEVVSDFHPKIQKLLALAPEIKIYKLLQRTPLDRLSRGRAIILGDAAALFQPKTSQGGTVALESAAALEHVFANAGPEQVLERAALYNEFMHPHVLTIQLWSDWSPEMGRDETRQRLEKVSKKPLPPDSQTNFSKGVQDYLYDFNIIKEVKDFLSNKAERNRHSD